MVTWYNKHFYIDQKPIEIHSASMHYFRSMPDRWEEYLIKIKNCGLNAVETYCAWNLHEKHQGEFDFSGNLDLNLFLSLAEKVGLYVILRPGPYICAEWEFGGLPGWLLKDEVLPIRTNSGKYLTYVENYFRVLMPIVEPHLQTNGGNIILVGAENEYGSFGDNHDYMNACVSLLKKYGVNVPIFTSDGESKMFIDGGRASECLCGLDFGYDCGSNLKEKLLYLQEIQPEAPTFHVEHWIGMFSHWGEKGTIYDTKYVINEIKQHLDIGASFNLYMFHGGTNFGFTNGANAFNTDPENRSVYTYAADITSYDYDAMLTEWGEVTPKYLAIQQLMAEYLNKKLPENPPVTTIDLGKVVLEECTPLFDNLDNIGNHFVKQNVCSMETLGQNFGYILYRTRIDAATNIDLLGFNGLKDRALIFFNGVFRGTIHRNDKKQYLENVSWLDEGGTLDILVENMGRVNFGIVMDRNERKGIDSQVYIIQKNGPSHILYNWDIYTLPMEKLDALVFNNNLKEEQPVFYKGHFNAEKRGECFVYLPNFTKGFVVVNGFNLGRYWSIGPQLSLYLPSCLLKKENEIIVFSENHVNNPVVEIKDKHILLSEQIDDKPQTIV